MSYFYCDSSKYHTRHPCFPLPLLYVVASSYTISDRTIANPQPSSVVAFSADTASVPASSPQRRHLRAAATKDRVRSSLLLPSRSDLDPRRLRSISRSPILPLPPPEPTKKDAPQSTRSTRPRRSDTGRVPPEKRRATNEGGRLDSPLPPMRAMAGASQGPSETNNLLQERSGKTVPFHTTQGFRRHPHCHCRKTTAAFHHRRKGGCDTKYGMKTGRCPDELPPIHLRQYKGGRAQFFSRLGNRRRKEETSKDKTAPLSIEWRSTPPRWNRRSHRRISTGGGGNRENAMRGTPTEKKGLWGAWDLSSLLSSFWRCRADHL
mmetsp:Transcript_6973/g.15079  ORF Transcript_6973/g.15079 Transcript_6973/m.15079 type:complete len:320 (+) Transcript_6973:1854-2813(+)